ncbi:hypothetical protein ADUPG1_001698, partial [Aduncisulcus paluster]
AEESELKQIAAREEKEFIVSEITAHRYGRKKPIEFKVRWLDYPPSEDTWEPHWSVKDLEAFEKYLERNPKLQKRFDEKDVNIKK